MASGKPIGHQEYGYTLRATGDTHEVWESQGGRFSIYEISPSGPRAVKSNIRSLDDAIDYMEILEGVYEPEVDITPTGRYRKGARVPIERFEELGIQHPLSAAEEWARRQIKSGEVYREPEGKRLRHPGERDTYGYTVLGETEDVIVWKSPRGRYSFEQKKPIKAVRSGIVESELQSMLGEREEEIPYQMTLPEFD